MTARDPKRAFVTRPSDPDRWIRTPEPTGASPGLVARFALNRCDARTIIARETAKALKQHNPPVLCSHIGQRIVFADAARTGRLASEMPLSELAAGEIVALTAEIERIAP